MSEEKKDPNMEPGVMSWNEIVTNDKDASIGFYTKLFGWTTEHMDLPNGMTYTMFKLGERPIGGCVVPPENPNPQSTWLSYVNVDDLDASIAKAKELGGTICKERVDLPMGSFAIVTDPQGATFAFWQSNGECCSGQ